MSAETKLCGIGDSNRSPSGVQDLSTRRRTTSEFRVKEKMLEVSGESIIPRVSGRTRDTRERQQAL